MLTGTPITGHQHAYSIVELLGLIGLAGAMGWWAVRWAGCYAQRLWRNYDMQILFPDAQAPAPMRCHYRLVGGALLMIATGTAYLSQGALLNALFHCVAAATLLSLAVIDIRIGLLPDHLTQPLMWAGLVLAWAEMGPGLHVAMTGVFVGYGLLAGVAALFKLRTRREGIGGGDLKLAAALGAWMGWQLLLWVLLLACLAGALWAIVQRKGFRHSMPFGPFLALPAVFALAAKPWLQIYL